MRLADEIAQQEKSPGEASLEPRRNSEYYTIVQPATPRTTTISPGRKQHLFFVKPKTTMESRIPCPGPASWLRAGKIKCTEVRLNALLAPVSGHAWPRRQIAFRCILRRHCDGT